MPIIGGKRYPYPKKKNKMMKGPSDSDMEEVFKNPNKAYDRPKIKASSGFNKMMAQKKAYKR